MTDEFKQDDGVQDQKPFTRLRLCLRDMTPLRLVGTNRGIKEQVLRNRHNRRMLGMCTYSVLWIECEVHNTVMLLDADAILVKYFAPANDYENWAVREAWMAVETAAWRRNSKDPAMQVQAEPHRAYATEMMWLAIGGCLQDVSDCVVFKQGSVDLHRHHDWQNVGYGVTATWNQNEPELGLYPYEGL